MIFKNKQGKEFIQQNTKLSQAISRINVKKIKISNQSTHLTIVVSIILYRYLNDKSELFIFVLKFLNASEGTYVAALSTKYELKKIKLEYCRHVCVIRSSYVTGNVRCIN